MQPKDYLYFLIDQNGQSYDIDENDVLVSTPSPSPLYNTPDGWQEKMLQVNRNGDYFGLLRSFSIPLRFVNNGAKILRNLVYRQGIEAPCLLGIAKLNRFNMLHENWYKGDMDFSKFNDTNDFFEINVAEDGIPKIMKAMEDVVVEIPLGNDAETIILDGINLKQSTIVSVIGQTGEPFFALGPHLAETSIISSEGEHVGTSAMATNFLQISTFTNDDDQIFNSNNPNLLATTNTTATVTFDEHFHTAFVGEHDQLPGLTIDVYVKIFSSTGVLRESLNVYSSNDIGTHDHFASHVIQGVYDFNMLEGDFLYVFKTGTIGPPGDDFDGIEVVAFYYFGLNDLSLGLGTINFQFELKYKPSNIRGYRIDTLFEKLVEKVFGADYQAVSNVLKPVISGNSQRTILVMSGDAIRNINGAVIKTTFKDFFKSMNVQKHVGLINDGHKIVIEKREVVYVGSTVADLGQVSSAGVKVSSATDMTFNTIKVGYPDQNYDDINGKNEFNTTSAFTTPITRVVAELDLVSPYRGDGYGIEFARINLEGKTTTDASSDNDVFILDAIGAPDDIGNIIWRPFRQDFVSVTGILSAATVYNIGISPKRLLGIHSSFIRGFLYGLDNKSIIYQTSDKNPNLVTVALGGATVTEKADVPVFQLSPGYTKPFYFEFSTRVPLNFIQLIELSKSGVFQFSDKGVTFTGSLITGSIKPVTQEEQTFKLLSSAGNDLIKKIH